MKESFEKIEKLVDITCRILKKNSFTSLENIRCPRSIDLNNPLYQIAYEYFGEFNYKKAYSVYKYWKRNDLFKSSVLDIMKEDSKNKLKITINSYEWDIIKTYIRQYNNRLKFCREFDNFLSQKMQEKGINCWLKCSHNYLSPSKTNNIWRGVYYCQDNQCLNKYTAKIVKTDTTELYIEVECDILNGHSEKIQKKIFCRGEKRETLALNLMSSGIYNVETENSLFNEITFNQNC
jgi:hypothetical protein